MKPNKKYETYLVYCCSLSAFVEEEIIAENPSQALIKFLEINKVHFPNGTHDFTERPRIRLKGQK